MTVCIAALCRFGDDPFVMGTSDRMLTSGDITFQPPLPKIYKVTNSIVTLIAGDATVHSEIYPKVCSRVAKLIEANPQEWVKVEDAARIYGQEIVQYRKRLAGRLLLEPLGLSWDTVFSKKSDLSYEFLDELSSKILQLKAEASTIVAGLDQSGAHIWHIDGAGVPSCDDLAGFISIGIGKRHAQSEFMFERHTPHSGLAETFMRIYTAKKRAEVAPGVGPLTDMFVIGGLGMTFVTLDENREKELPMLGPAYEEMIAKQSQAKREAENKIDEVIKQELAKLNKEAESKDQGATATQPPISLPSGSETSGSKQ